jgi:hypothetical protein
LPGSTSSSSRKCPTIALSCSRSSSTHRRSRRARLVGRRVDVVLGDDVGAPEAPNGTKHAVGLGEHGRLVDGEVDHAVGIDDIDRGVRQ